MNTKILIVEDEMLIAYNLEQILLNKGYTVLPIASRADQAIEYTKKYSPDVILMDIMLKGAKTGIDAAKEIFSKKNTPIIFLTCNSHIVSKVYFRKTDKYSIMPKPPSESQLEQHILRAVAG